MYRLTARSGVLVKRGRSEAVRAALAGGAYGFVNCLILSTVVAGTVLGTYASWRWYESVGLYPAVLAVIVVLGGFALCLWIGAREVSSDVIAVLVLAAILASRVLYTAAASQPLISDFRLMWEYAASVALHGYHPPTAHPFIETRALPFLIPVAILSGGRAVGYQLANGLAVVASGALVYALARSLGGRKAALIALVIVALSPEPLLASEIDTHDIPGTLFALVSLGLMHSIDQALTGSRSRFVVRFGLLPLSVALGVVVFLADLQRGLGIFLMATAVLGVVLAAVGRGGGPRVLRMAFYGLVLPYVVLAGCRAGVRSLLLADGSDKVAGRATWAWIAAYGNAESSGSLVDFREVQPFLDLLDDAELRAFAITRVMSDLADAPLERPVNYARRVAGLYQLGGQYHFYLDDTRWGARWGRTPLVPSQAAAARIGRFFRAYTVMFRVAFLLAGCAALVWLLVRRGPDARLHRPIGFVAIMTLALGLLGEVQPRYLFAVWFIVPIYVGLWAADLGRGFRIPREPAVRRLGEIVAVAIGVGTLGAVGILGLRAFGDGPGGKLIRAADFAGDATVVPQGRYKFLVSSSAADGGLRAGTPGRSGSGVRRLDAFITVGALPDRGCRASIRVEAGHVTWQREVNAETPVPVRAQVRNVVGEDGRIALEIQARSPLGDECPVQVAFPWLRRDTGVH